MKKILFVLFIFSFGFTFAQEGNFVLTFKGEKIEITDVEEYYSSQVMTFRYTKKDGKIDYVDPKKIQYIQFEEEKWISIPHKKLKKGNLRHVVAYNKEYILYRTNNNNISTTNLHVLNRFDFTKPEYQRMYFLSGGNKDHSEGNMERLELLKPWFGDCKDLIKKMEENINSNRSIYRGIDVFKCDDSEELIKSLEPYYKNF